MIKNDLTIYKNTFKVNDLKFYTDLFSKPIWGDMGEDCASIHLSVENDTWHLHFIRTQSGEPYPLSDAVCDVVDEYEKALSDDELFDFLMLHGKTKEFEEFMSSY